MSVHRTILTAAMKWTMTRILGNALRNQLVMKNDSEMIVASHSGVRLIQAIAGCLAMLQERKICYYNVLYPQNVKESRFYRVFPHFFLNPLNFVEFNHLISIIIITGDIMNETKNHPRPSSKPNSLLLPKNHLQSFHCTFS